MPLDQLDKVQSPVGFILELIIYIIVALFIFEKVIRPCWGYIVKGVKHQERNKVLTSMADKGYLETLAEVAKFLEPNGKPLAAHFTDNDKAHENLFTEVAAIKTMIETHVVNRIPNGRRFDDPPRDNQIDRPDTPTGHPV